MRARGIAEFICRAMQCDQGRPISDPLSKYLRSPYMRSEEGSAPLFSTYLKGDKIAGSHSQKKHSTKMRRRR